MIFPGTYIQLAGAYAAQGDFEKGWAILEEYTQQHPESAAGLRNLGRFAVVWGKLDEALPMLEKAEALGPGHMDTATGLWSIYALREQWEEADAIAEKMKAARDPARKWMGTLILAMMQLYRGNSKDALVLAEEAMGAFPQPSVYSAIARGYVAETLLLREEPGAALDMAKRALEESGLDYPQQQNLRLAALAEANMGRWENAENIAAEYKRRAEASTSLSWKRQEHRLAGELALARGDAAVAIERMEKAESMLATRRAIGPPPPPHVPVWYSLASAYLAAGQGDEAAEWFERIIESGVERNLWAVEYIRSLYFLGKISENRGDMEQAREYYRRFYDFWKDGDLDRERVEEVQRKL
jgi:pentatricopeptide repeat protein